MNKAWTWCSLSEVTIPGSTWNPRTDPRSLIRYVDVSAVSRDELAILSDAEHSAADAPSRARKIVKTGDTIFATVRPTLRRIAQVPPSLDSEIVSTAFCVLRPNPSMIHPDFLFFAIQLEDVTDRIAEMQTGASYPAVRDTDVLNQAIPLPPLSDQNEIALTLKLVRSAMLGQKRCEDAATALKRAAMQTLFTRGLRGEAQKETEIGPVPESWEPVAVSSVAVVKGGKRMPKGVALTSENTGQPYIRVTDFRDHGVDAGQVLFVPDGYKSVIARYTISSRDVYISIAGTIGLVGQISESLDGANLTENAAKVSVTDERVTPRFLMYALASDTCQTQIAQSTATNAQPKLALVRIEQLQLPIPPKLDEQREIVAMIDAIDHKIDLHRRKRAALEELFSVLLHKLMTGLIRVGGLLWEKPDSATTQPEAIGELV